MMSEPPAAASIPEATVSFKIKAGRIMLKFCLARLSPSLPSEMCPPVAPLNRADAAKVVYLIVETPEDEPYESLKQPLMELHTLNFFQRYQALMALTLVVD